MVLAEDTDRVRDSGLTMEHTASSTARWLPQLLGWLLIVGGAGYVISAFVSYLADGADLVAGLLTVPATIGELWIIGYLLIVGVREHGSGAEEAT